VDCYVVALVVENLSEGFVLVCLLDLIDETDVAAGLYIKLQHYCCPKAIDVQTNYYYIH
jgi:hypothetical protein